MLVFDLSAEQVFNPQRHVEKILGVVGEGDVTVACWDPGQTSPNHMHPNATEILIRDIGNIIRYFSRKYKLRSTEKEAVAWVTG